MRFKSLGRETNLFSSVQTINQRFMNIFRQWLFIFTPKIDSSTSLLPLLKNELLTLNFKRQIHLFLLVRQKRAYMSWGNERKELLPEHTQHLYNLLGTDSNKPAWRGAALLVPIWKSSKSPEQPFQCWATSPARFHEVRKRQDIRLANQVHQVHEIPLCPHTKKVQEPG